MSAENARGTLAEQLIEIRTKLEDHITSERRWQDRIEEVLDEQARSTKHLKDSVDNTTQGLHKITAMIWVLMIMIPVITGLLTYIFKTHTHQ